MLLKFATEKCARCEGRGRIETYRRVAGGVCAQCGGSGRQTSKAGLAARRAFERAVNAATSIPVTDVTEGMTLMMWNYERGMTVTHIEIEKSPSGSTVYTLREIREGRHDRTVGYYADQTVQRYMPDTVAAIAQRIADRHQGAILKGAPAAAKPAPATPAAPVVAKPTPAPAAAPAVDRTRDLALLTFDRYAARAAA